MAKQKTSEPEVDTPSADQTPKSSARDTGKRIAEGLQTAGANLRSVASDAAQNSAKINMAVIDQVEANTRAAFAAMRAAASAQSLPDIVKVQRDFVKDQGERSVAQARELGELIAQFGRDTVSQVTGRKG